MAVKSSTLDSSWIPTCSRCASQVGWTISEVEYRSQEAFWKDWICKECNGGIAFALVYWKRQQPRQEKG